MQETFTYQIYLTVSGASGKVKVKKRGEQTARVVAEDVKYNYITPVELM